jgi:two-component system, LuxR family, response regulator FixJ
VDDQEKPKVVLIVDDYELIRGSLGGPMKEAGFPGLTFASAEQFLTSREEKRTACLILDIRMPGMSGLELQAKLNEAYQRNWYDRFTRQGDEKLRLQASESRLLLLGEVNRLTTKHCSILCEQH